MGCGSSGGSTTSTTSQPSPVVTAAYQQALGQTNNVVNQPLQQYTGSLVSGFVPDQLSAMGTINAAQGIAQPYINAAGNYFQSAGQPIQPMAYNGQTISNLMSPYINNVANATEKQLNQQNEVQQQQLQGNAASQNAYGGDRTAVAQALLANQQQLAEAPTIANLYNTGFGQAQSEFNALNQAQIGAQEASGWLQQGAGYGLANLGQTAQNSALTGANAQLQSGALQQQLNQQNLNIPYELFQQQQAYPFQVTGWGSNIAEGLGSGLGGSSSTTSPGPSAISQIAGLGTAATGVAGLGNSLGWFGGSPSAGTVFDPGTSTALTGGFPIQDFTSARGGRIERASGGGMPLLGENGMVPDVSLSVVPAGTSGHSNSQLSPFTPVTTQTTSGGGGGGGSALGAVGTIASAASKIIPFFLNEGGRVGLAGGGTSGAPTPTSAQWLPANVDPNTTVNLPVHSGVAPVNLATAAPSTNSEITDLGHLQPLQNYAPTFDQHGYPNGMTPTAPGYTAPGPMSIGISSGVLQRPGPGGSAAPAGDSGNPTGGSGNNGATANQLTPEQQAFLGWGGPGQPADWETAMFGPGGNPQQNNDSGGSNRGGRINRDIGGATPSGVDTIQKLISLGYIPATPQGGVGHGGVGIPAPPHPVQDTSSQDMSSLSKSVGSLGKLFSKDSSSGDSDGGAVYATDARQGFDAGGYADLSAAPQQQMTGAGMGSPQQGLIQQYLSLPLEQLQELAMRSQQGGNSAQSQAIQQALRIKKMNPVGSSPTSNQQQQATLGATPYSGLSPSVAGFGSALNGTGMSLGGRAHFDEGGDAKNFSPPPDVPDHFDNEPGPILGDYAPGKNPRSTQVAQAANLSLSDILPPKNGIADKLQNAEAESIGRSGGVYSPPPAEAKAPTPAAPSATPSPATLASPPPADNLEMDLGSGKTTMPQPTPETSAAPPKAQTTAGPVGGYGTDAQGTFIPPGGTQQVDIHTGQPADLGTKPASTTSGSAPKPYAPGDFISHFEDNILHQYSDIGFPAIGIGHDITDGERNQGFIKTASGNVPLGKNITPEQSQAIFKQDWDNSVSTIRKDVPGFDKLNSNQQEALISYVFNTGHLPTGAASAINSGNMQTVSDSLRNGIATGRGVGYMPQLAARRAAEAQLFMLPEGQHLTQYPAAIPSGGADSLGTGSGHASTVAGAGPAAVANLGTSPVTARMDALIQQLQKMSEPDRRQTLANNPWMALIVAGLGMMASRSPFPGVAIGEGGLAGAKFVQEQGAQSAKEDTAHNESANRNAMLQATLLGHEQTAEHEAADLDLRAKQLAQQGNFQGSQIANWASERREAEAREAREARIADQTRQDAQAKNAIEKQNADSLEKQRKYQTSKPLQGVQYDDKGNPIYGQQVYNDQTGQWEFVKGTSMGRPQNQTYNDRVMNQLLTDPENQGKSYKQIYAEMKDPNSRTALMRENLIQHLAEEEAKTAIGQSFDLKSDATQRAVAEAKTRITADFDAHVPVAGATPAAKPAAPAATPAAPAQGWKYSAGSGKAFSNDGTHWFNADGTAYKP